MISGIEFINNNIHQKLNDQRNAKETKRISDEDRWEQEKEILKAFKWRRGEKKLQQIKNPITSLETRQLKKLKEKKDGEESIEKEKHNWIKGGKNRRRME